MLYSFRHITQFEELELLKEFEKRETNYTTRYRTKKEECAEVGAKVSTVGRDMNDYDPLLKDRRG